MEIELKRYAIAGYNEAIHNFDGNRTLPTFIKTYSNNEWMDLEHILHPKEIKLNKEKSDKLQYKITPYMEKIHDLNIPLQYKSKIIKYCHYSNIKIIRSIYKINKVIKLSGEEYIKSNTAKAFIKWKLRKLIFYTF
jgi:hypothetical protein